MNHFNFFESSQKEKKSLNVPLVSAALIICAAVILGGAFLFVKLRLGAVRGQLAYLESVENDEAFKKQYSQEEELENRLLKAQDDYLFLRVTDWLTENGSTVNEGLVKDLLSLLPKGTKIYRMTVSRYDISIEGISQDLDTMIAAQRSLIDSGKYSYVFITTAKEDAHTDENGEKAVTFTGRMILSEKGIGK